MSDTIGRLADGDITPAGADAVVSALAALRLAMEINVHGAALPRGAILRNLVSRGPGGAAPAGAPWAGSSQCFGYGPQTFAGLRVRLYPTDLGWHRRHRRRQDFYRANPCMTTSKALVGARSSRMIRTMEARPRRAASVPDFRSPNGPPVP